MAVDQGVGDQGGIEDDRDPAADVVERAERGDGAGRHTEHVHQERRVAERHAAGGADPVMDLLQIDCRVLLRRDQKQRAFLVFQEQVLGVGARNLAAKRAALLDGEQRRVLDRVNRDAEASLEMTADRLDGRGRRLKAGPSRPIVLHSARRRRYKPPVRPSDRARRERV